MQNGLIVSALFVLLPAVSWADGSDRERLTNARDRAIGFADEFVGKDCLQAESTGAMEGVVVSMPSVRATFDILHGMTAVQLASNEGETAFVVNDEYCFEVLRLKGKDNWMLLDYAFDDSADINTKELGLSAAIPRPTVETYHSDFCGLRGLEEAPIDAEYLLSGSGVKLLSSSDSEENIQCTYSRTGSEAGELRGQSIQGTIVFSKKNNCLPVSLEEKADAKSKRVKRSYELSLPQAIKRFSKEEYYVADKQTSSRSTEESIRTTPRRRRDFTLTAFGLPEPAKPVSRVSQFSVWLAVTAFGVGCIILYFLIRKRRLAN